MLLPRLWVQLLPFAHVSVTGVRLLLIGFLVNPRERPRIYGAILEQKERRLPFSSH
jgi:hypothetical protein